MGYLKRLVLVLDDMEVEEDSGEIWVALHEEFEGTAFEPSCKLQLILECQLHLNCSH